MAPPANHRAILNMLLGVSVDLSRSDFMRTEVLRRAEVADARVRGLPGPKFTQRCRTVGLNRARPERPD
jgi:hypothetical protein